MSAKGRRVVVARPYGPKIHEKMGLVFERLGLPWASATVIPSGTPDDEVATRLPAKADFVLVIPFHAHRDEQGKVVNGLDVVEAIALERPDLDAVPILMPVSAAGFGAASLRLARLQDKEDARQKLHDRVLLLPEDEIDSAETISAIKRHLA